MLAIIPVKMSDRLPGKHLLPFNGRTIIEEVVDKVSTVFETLVYSRIDIPISHIRDSSENIMELVFILKHEYGDFALVGGDMVFFKFEDLQLLKSHFKGSPVVPADSEGNLEPMFSIYSGEPRKTNNLREALKYPQTVYVPREKFSEDAFFNINTKKDYDLALIKLNEKNYF